MRIRKNTKNLQLSGTNSTFSLNPVPQATICQLNQSRWDVKVDEDFNVFRNDDSLNPTGVAKNAAPSDISKKGKRHAQNPTEVAKSITAPLNERKNVKQCTKNPAGGAKSAAPLNACPKRKRRATNVTFSRNVKTKVNTTSLEGKGKNKIDDELVLCPEINKSGWQCGRPVEHGFTMCKDHLELMSFLVDSRISTPNIKMTSDVLYYAGYGPSTARRRAMKRGSSSRSSSRMAGNDASVGN